MIEKKLMLFTAAEQSLEEILGVNNLLFFLIHVITSFLFFFSQRSLNMHELYERLTHP